ncbi:MAG: glycine cleavage T C-terminal barrel domain-containing protein, partial [Pseudomonadota bacterium]
LQSDEAWSRAGDYVLMTALDNLTCVSTACPDDIDPINGWNPTDVHVRIYRENTPIQRAVAYRETAKAVPDVSEESAFHPRTSKLTRAFRPARNIWAPTHFPSTGAIGEYWACRTAVTVQDMSALRKFDVKGPDAERLLQWVTTRDVARLPVYRGIYTLICDEMGQVVDDGTLFRLAPDLFRWCCGSEESGRTLSAYAAEHGLRVRIEAMRGALPSLALQGPRSRDLLREIVYTAAHVPALDDLKWFGATIARLRDREGAPFFLTRTGYTGELGYELFMARADAVPIWDALMEAGASFGITPMGGAALDMLRIEAGLMAAGAEFAPGVDAFEAGLGFAVSLKKPAFMGRDALERNAAAPRRKLIGLLFDGDEVAGHGDTVFVGERPVGVVTSAVRSPTLERGIAMARVAVEWAETGTDLEVGRLDGRMKRFHATATTIPFVDPKRERPRA